MDIHRPLQERGWLHVREAIDWSAFRKLAGAMGTVLREEDIRLHVTTRGAHSPRALGLHTDHADADVVGWWCLRPGGEPGQGGITLVDAAPTIRNLGLEEVRALLRVRMKCPDPDGSATRPVALLRARNRRLELYYAAWNVERLADPQAKRAFGRFRERIELAASESATSWCVHLRHGECLFVDNKRMLHGRGALSKDSTRFLKRLWIRRAGDAGLGNVC